MSSGRYASKPFQLWPVVLALIVLTAGCERDPNVQKQKYFVNGNSYFDQGKYREATIEYLNAIQIDKGFGDAHYRLAQSYLRLGIWAGAYQELLRTTELQPNNLRSISGRSFFRPSSSSRRRIVRKTS